LSNWKDPGYDFRWAEGNKLLQGRAAAQGDLLSGPTLKAIANYGQNAASQEYSNAFNRFMGNRALSDTEYQQAYDRFSGNRAFQYGVDTGDRSFDYLTHTGD
ncbi:hypothetical protein, partial [Staphylococcus aureus]